MADTKPTAPKKTAAPKAAPKAAKPSVETQTAAPAKVARSRKPATPVETAAPVAVAASAVPAGLTEKVGDVQTDAPAVAASAQVVEATAPDQAEIDRMIAEAAYYLAEKRNFQPGSEAEDWAIATEQVMAKLRGDDQA